MRNRRMGKEEKSMQKAFVNRKLNFKGMELDNRCLIHDKLTG